MDAKSQYKARFFWAKEEFQRGKLKLVQCDTDNLPPEKTTGNWLANYYNQSWIFRIEEQKHASHTVNTKGTLKLKNNRFLYMDIGAWLNGKQTFGVVCGSLALLCDYYPNGGRNAPPPDVPKEGLLHEFLQIEGIVAWDDQCKRIPPPFRGNPDHLYLILPDTHIPQATSDPSRWKLYGTARQIGITREEGLRRDIFASLKSVDALTKLLTAVVGASWASKVSLVHIGDMYELWAGRPCLFQQSEKPMVKLVTQNPSRSAEDTARMLGEWISGTHFLHHELFATFDDCKRVFKTCVFLHGNHDSYLSVPEVVHAANQYERDLLETANRRAAFQGSWSWETYPATTIYSRVPQYRAECGIFFEHGQRCDASNRDGNASGPAFTNVAASYTPLKALDSTRRETFVTGAAAMSLLNGMDFGLYVMGHTHEPVLKYVDISHYTDKGGEAVARGITAVEYEMENQR